MQKEWIVELIARGGIEKAGHITDYGDPRAEVSTAAHATVSCALTHIGIIRVSGPDARTFLQSQLSNDALGLVDASQLSAYCTAQGRMIALFRIVPRADELYLLLPHELLETVLKRLRMYVLRAKVSLAAADDWAVLGLSGPQSAPLLLQTQLPVPEAPPRAAVTNDITVLAIPGPTPRYLLLGPESTIRALGPLMPEAPLVGSSAWSWLDITAGLPTIGTATSEAFVPQMANLDILDGINFRKGCYPGQEIVARTHYLGRLKQRLYLASLPADIALPMPGTPLSAPNLPGQPAGTIVDAQRGPEGQIDLLAVIQISSHDEGAVFLGETPLSFRDLPYPLAASC